MIKQAHAKMRENPMLSSLAIIIAIGVIALYITDYVLCDGDISCKQVESELKSFIDIIAVVHGLICVVLFFTIFWKLGGFERDIK